MTDAGLMGKASIDWDHLDATDSTMRVSWYRGAGASMAAGKADRRADAVGVEERSAVRCPLMKRLGCRPASSTLMFRMSKSGRAARRATIDRGSRRGGTDPGG
jgi:hypothetical protein